MSKWKTVHFDSIDSTNTEAKRRARMGDTGPAVIMADVQTAGRGRFDRRWESPAGSGLLMTQLFAPRGVAAADAGGAVFLSAVAMCRALREITGAQVLIKWPNDLVLNGKKICGMLAECGFDGNMCGWIALGLGLNLKRDALPPELVYASSVEAETGIAPDIPGLLDRYLDIFDEIEALWEREGLAPVISMLEPFSATIGRDVRVDGVPARALKIDPDGALVCGFDDGIRRVLAGDVSVRGITDYV